MAQDNKVSFKAYLLQGDTNRMPEVRRFEVCDVSSFEHLKEKLQHVFPSLGNQNIIVIWNDADGDDVIISSDDELLIAHSEMGSAVHKLYIKVLKDNAQSRNTASAGQTIQAAYPIYKGVICNQCGKQIEGILYHYTNCEKYDLCGACAANQGHWGQIMPYPMPIAKPVQQPYMGQPYMGQPYMGQPYMGRPMAPSGMDRSGDQVIQRPYKEFKQNVSAEQEKMKTKCETLGKVESKTAKDVVVGQTVGEYILQLDEKKKTDEQGKKGEEKMETEETNNEEPKSNAGGGSNLAGPSNAPQSSASYSGNEPECKIPKTNVSTVLDLTSPRHKQEESRQTFKAAKLIHKRRICEHCDKEIEGFSYHCIDCQDYHLCGTCGAKQIHCEHFMVRYPVPAALQELPSYIRRLMAHLGDKGRKRPYEKSKQNVSAEEEKMQTKLETLGKDEKKKKNEQGEKGEEKMETEETNNEEPKSNAAGGSNKAGPSNAAQASTSDSVNEPECKIPKTNDSTVLDLTSAQQQQQENHEKKKKNEQGEKGEEGN